MSTETTVSDAVHDEHVEHGHDAHDEHPTEQQYWVVFAVLAVVTAAEVAWSFLGLSGPALVVPLILMMLFKFVVVAGVFMHLYFDFKMVTGNGKYFTYAFASAMLLAVAVYFIVFATFEWNIAYFG